MPLENIISISDLVALRERLSGRIIVLATGCFDILHVGHLHFLRESCAQGEVLVIGINSDRSIKMIKGINRPIIAQEKRAEMVAALRYVSYVFIYDDTVADDCIRRLRPDVFVLGEESVETYPSEPATAKQVGARIYVVARVPSASTTSITADIRKQF